DPLRDHPQPWLPRGALRTVRGARRHPVPSSARPRRHTAALMAATPAARSHIGGTGMHHDDVALSPGERRAVEALAAALPAEDRWLAARLGTTDDGHRSLRTRRCGDERHPSHAVGGVGSASNGWHWVLTRLTAVTATAARGGATRPTTGSVERAGVSRRLGRRGFEHGDGAAPVVAR